MKLVFIKMDIRSNGVIFLGLLLLLIVLITFMDYETVYTKEGLTSGSHLKSIKHITSFQQFVPPSHLRVFDDSRKYLTEKHVDGYTLSRDNTEKMSTVWLHGHQTEENTTVRGNETSVSSAIQNYNNPSIDDENTSSPHPLCACGHCFNVTFKFRGTGHIFVDIKAFNNSNLSKTNIHKDVGKYDDVSYFDMKVQGDHEIWSALVSDQDVSLTRLNPIRLSSSGNYNVSLTLIYTNKSSAYGLDKFQRKEMHCRLCQTNGTCHLMLQVNVSEENVDNTRSGWVPIRLDEMSLNKTILSDKDSAAYFRFSEDDRTFFKCPSCEGSQLLDKCLVKKRFMLLGDSHTQKIWNVLQKHIRRVQSKTAVQWKMREDGHGVYHNVSPDRNFKGYVRGEVPPVFVKGDMIEGLQSGLYSKLQQKNHFDAWIFSTGHWDLRDTSKDEYISHLEKLFQMWSEFQRTTGVWLVWNGIPAYSFNRHAWGGLERRTNVKIALADHQTKDLCRRYNITYVPFFDISYPFYSKSCDTHHYLCEDTISPIGSVQLNLLLQTICVDM